eukprot:scaffold2324_cov264-Chaetoceros_neogracile.AAC.5
MPTPPKAALLENGGGKQTKSDSRSTKISRRAILRISINGPSASFIVQFTCFRAMRIDFI